MLGGGPAGSGGGGGGGGGGDTPATVVKSSGEAGGLQAVGGELAAVDAAAAAAAMLGSNDSNNNNHNSGEVDDKVEGERSFGGNRWPRQETLALLKIRSDMDVAFRDASVKGPLWDEVSRKLAEMGYYRSAKKCKEKFENVLKYHKRTKDGRTGKSEGKTYKFFDQLEAFENHPPNQPQKSQAPSMATGAMPTAAVNNPTSVSHVTVPLTTLSTIPQNLVTSTTNLTIPSLPQLNPTIHPQPQTANFNIPSQSNHPSSFPSSSADLMSDSSSSSTSSDLELEGRRRKKRKWKDFLEGLMKEVVQKQEQMQKKFLEAIEKREHDRMVREESWRIQELARINREREILAQERSAAAAKDEAVMTLLRRLSEQQNPAHSQIILQPPQQPPPAPPPRQATAAPPQPVPAPPELRQPQSAPAAPPQAQPQPQPVANILSTVKVDNGDQNFMAPSPSRWPKVEVEALIKMRSSLDAKYQENGPKGPLWEEISAEMRKLGYNRSAKRCKEKWENINKYFKKVKESNRKRPEDSKTCPYFHQLDALYRQKNKVDSSSSIRFIKPENSLPLMVRPEQQWPPPPPPPPPPQPTSSEPENRRDPTMRDMEREQQMNQILDEGEDEEEEEEEDDDDDEDKDGDEEEEEGSERYEIVASKQVTMGSGAE